MAPRYLLFSVVLDNWTDVMGAVKDPAYDERMRTAQTPDEAPVHPEAFVRSGGCLALLDWQEQKILGTKALDLPLGFAFDQNDWKKLWVAAWKPNQFHLLEGNEITRRVGHPLFCHIHTVRSMKQPGHLLVTSSGVDLVAELDANAEAGEQVKWSWLATEHGYPTPEGQPPIDRNANYNHVWWSCAKQSTHVNSAMELDDNTILCTLPLANTIARVDKNSGDATALRSDMAFPHDLHAREGGFTVANSRAGQALLLADDMTTERVIQTKSPWLQHALLAKDGGTMFGLNNRNVSTKLNPEDSIASNSVYQLDLNGKLLRELDVGPENRLYEIMELTEEQAQFWAEAWSGNNEIDISEWKWFNSEFDRVSHVPDELAEEDGKWISEHNITVTRLEPHGILLKNSQEGKLVTELPVERLKVLSWQFGLVVLRGFAAMDKEKMVQEAEKFGKLLHWGFGPVLDVKVNDDPKTSVLSTDHVEMHFDGIFREVPSHQFFQCAKAPAPSSGGQTTFFFNARFLEDIENEQPGWIERYGKFRFQHWITASEYFGGLTAPFDLITRHPHTGAPVLRYHELHKPYRGLENQNEGKQTYKMTYDARYYDATEDELREFHEFLQPKLYDEKYLYKHQWEDGDFALTDNHGMLHGRLAFNDHTGRHLMRIHIM